MVPQQQLLYKLLHCVPFQNKRVPFYMCFLSRQLLMNCTVILANIINSKLILFGARFADKVVLDGCYKYEFWRWFPLNMRRSVAHLKTRTRSGPKSPYYRYMPAVSPFINIQPSVLVLFCRSCSFIPGVSLSYILRCNSISSVLRWLVSFWWYWHSLSLVFSLLCVSGFFFLRGMR